MWSPYSIENKSMALSYDVYMDENGNLIPQNMSRELYIHSSSVTYEEYRNNNVTLIEDNVMIGNTMVNSSAMIVNNLNYPVEYIVSFNLIGEKRYFDYGSDGYSILNGTSTNISGIPVRWQSSGFVRGVKAYSNGTDALILPYAVDLKSGGAFFIDPTIGKKPLGETCSIYYYGSVSATLSAPSSTALGDTITLSVTINSLSGSSPREVNFYVSGHGQTDNIYSTSVTNGNTYSTSWTDNIVGNLTFCANYLYDKETCDYSGHIYTSYGYSSLGSKSIHGSSMENAIGYNGNNVIYYGPSQGFPIGNPFNLLQTKGSTEDNIFYDQHYYMVENVFGLNATYAVQEATSGKIHVRLFLGTSGLIFNNDTTYGNPMKMDSVSLGVTISNALTGVCTHLETLDNVGSNIIGGSQGENYNRSVGSSIISSADIVASLLSASFSMLALPSIVLGVLAIVLGGSSQTTQNSGNGQVNECFPVDNEVGIGGGYQFLNYSAGTEVFVKIPSSDSGNNMEVNIEAISDSQPTNEIEFSKSFIFVPGFVIQGKVCNSTTPNSGYGGLPIFFENLKTGAISRIFTNNSGNYKGQYMFFADQDTEYKIMVGSDTTPMNNYDQTYTTSNFGSNAWVELNYQVGN